MNSMNSFTSLVELRQGLCEYFQNPDMTFVEHKEPQPKAPRAFSLWSSSLCSPFRWSMYMVQIHSYLLKDHYFLVLLVPYDESLQRGTVKKMSELEFAILQTRNLVDYEKYLHLPVQKYTPFQRISCLQTPISCVQSSVSFSEYTSDHSIHPFSLHLLHTRKSLQEYSTKGTLTSALETYQCVLFLESPSKEKESVLSIPSLSSLSIPTPTHPKKNSLASLFPTSSSLNI